MIALLGLLLFFASFFVFRIDGDLVFGVSDDIYISACYARNLAAGHGAVWYPGAAPVEGFIGFAIGRSIWWEPLKGFLAGDLERGAASDQIADNYLRFVKVYSDAESGARV